MKWLPGFPDWFMSPVTGKLRLSTLPDLPADWIITGDKLGHSTLSPAFKDLRIDVRYLNQDLNQMKEATFLVQHPHGSLPRAQALDGLKDGLLKQTKGIVAWADPATDYLEHKLPAGTLWMGDASNKPVSKATLNLSNLPDLGMGKIWRGDLDGRPEESVSLILVETDIALLNARFLLGEFIMGDALVHATWPKSQFLIDIANGMLKKTGKTLQHAIPGTDYVDTPNGIVPNEERLPVWSANNQKLLTNSLIQIMGQDLREINSIHAVLVQATNCVTSDQNMVARTSMDTRQLILFDYSELHRYTNYVSLRGPASVNQNLTWVMPDAASTLGQVLTDIGPAGLADRQLGFRAVAAHDAMYILKEPNPNLPNAQAIQLLGPDLLLKSDPAGTGAIAAAVVSVDYPSVASVQAAQAAADLAAAGVAALNTQILPFSAATVAPFNLGTVVTATAATTAVNTAAITAVGATVAAIQGTDGQIHVSHTGNITISMADNPILPGTESLSLPSGTTAQRPAEPKAGMMRWNPDGV